MASFTSCAPTLLIVDAFSGHTTPAIMGKLAELNVTPVVIPGDCTAKIQPLDVSINKPFKDRLKVLHSAYLRDTDVDENGRTPKPSPQQLLQFVKRAWGSILNRESMVSESFSACGITQALGRAVQERERQRGVLDAAIVSDDSDEEFLGFS